MFKDKILAQLTEKYKSFPGVSKKFLGLWADKLDSKVTEESQIEGVINELDNLPISIPDMANEMQKEGDRRVAEYKRTSSNPKPDPVDPNKPNPQSDPVPQSGDPKPNSGQPDNEVVTLLRTLTERVSKLEGEKTEQTIYQKLKTQLNNVPEWYWSEWARPTTEDGITAFVEKVNTKYSATKQEQAAAGFGAGVSPAASSGSTNGQASKDEIKKLASQL